MSIKELGEGVFQDIENNLVGGGVSFGLVPLTTDYGKSSKNSALMGYVYLPYYDKNGHPQRSKEPLKGYLTSGFGWSITNNYEDLLPVSSSQQHLNRMTQGLGELANAVGFDVPSIGGFDLNQMPGKTFLSLQQTMSIWLGMQKPNFSVGLLFFDGKGDDSTAVTTAAYIAERALYPYVDPIGQSGVFNLTMGAPGGYMPGLRTNASDGNPNKTYGMTAEGLTTLQIGRYATFNDVICTGAQFAYSNIMLDNGNPQWLNITFNFITWKQPTLADLAYRYTGGG